MKNEMKKIFTCLALCLLLLSAVAQEAPAIEGLYGVKLGAKPGEKAIDLGGGMASIFNIRIVAIPDDFEPETNEYYNERIVMSISDDCRKIWGTVDGRDETYTHGKDNANKDDAANK